MHAPHLPAENGKEYFNDRKHTCTRQKRIRISSTCASAPNAVPPSARSHSEPTASVVIIV